MKKKSIFNLKIYFEHSNKSFSNIIVKDFSFNILNFPKSPEKFHILHMKRRTSSVLRLFLLHNCNYVIQMNRGNASIDNMLHIQLRKDADKK